MSGGAAIETRVLEIGRELHARAASRRPAFFEPQDWLRRAIEQSLGDERLRTALFRFVDVLPSLRSARDVARHLEEYFSRSDHALGGLFLLAQALHAGWLVAPVVRRNVVSLARRFIVEERGEALFRTLEGLRREGAGFTLDLVGETVVAIGEARAMLERYERLLRETSERARRWPSSEAVDLSPAGEIPRVSLSVKLSSLYARFDPLDPECERVTAARLRRLLREAARLGAAITVDMEHRALKDATLSVFRSVLDGEEFSEGPPVGIALQAYLPETEADLEELLEWAGARGRRIGVRLVKGAYWDSEIVWAKSRGWPVPVFTDKAATDAAYERLARRLLECAERVEVAFGSHNVRSLSWAIAVAEALGVPRRAYEIQMLYGMAEPLRQALIERGERVRVYVPVGDLLAGMAYLIRRLLENTSNVSFLRQVYAEGRDPEALLSPPRAESLRAEAAPATESAPALPGGFRNEPLLDFSREPVREAVAAALDAARAALPEHPAELRPGEIVSRNPARPEQWIGVVRTAGAGEIDAAVGAAAEAFRAWAATPIGERAERLRRAAERMRRERTSLVAAVVLEVGKGWRDADAEVAEAIDFLEYYAAEAIRIGSGGPTQRLPGEANELRYEPLGVVAAISPWNFPLSIPAGMVSAALAAGNAVCFKPAEQSPVIGTRLHGILLEAGVPEDALHLIHGDGRVGSALVRHPGIAAVVFTGSKAVGLEILRVAAETASSAGRVKRAICEMGGKNAIVVDEDADPDEAVLGVLESAFGYQGQKCSACSRLVVVGEGYERFLRRLAEAARTLRIGPPEDPRYQLGPLIDEEAVRRVAQAVLRARREGRVVLDTDLVAADGSAAGPFVGPVIVDGLPAEHPLAQEEIFGPLLVAFRARTFEEALAIANSSSYALTGGVYSRSPAHLELARREFWVGNLYLNRPITGAVVGRHPFGGLRLSGIGWKAGGPDYLKQFLESRTISENTLRHGFVPEV